MEDIQATAKWANRMLRPLTSVYRRLEKHQETLAIIAAESRIQDNQEDSEDTQVLGVTGAVSARDNLSGSDADEDDPVWIPGKKPEQRRIRHKYSGRGDGKTGRRRTRLSLHSPEVPRTLPGAIELATPLITGKRWEGPSSVRSQPSAEQRKLSHPEGQLQAFRDRYPLHKSPWQELLDQSGDSGFADIAHNLDRVLQNFLCNTRIPKRESGGAPAEAERGARSLLSMVVRRLPEFIASEQEAQDEEDEDGDDNMCDMYFTELESFYAPHGRGWKPLREAVRAQGIYLVSSMIVNKWVTDPIACALIEKCRYHEPDACKSLLSTFLSTRSTYPYPLALKPAADSSLPGDPVRLLRKYAYYGPAHRAYIFDELAKLLTRGVLPPEWVATKLWTSWMTRATISFSREDDDCASASRLIEAVLISASDARPPTNIRIPAPRRPTKRNPGRARATRTSSAAPVDVPDFVSPCPVLVEDALSNHVTSLLAALCGMHISRSRKLDGAHDADGTKAGHIINHLSFTIERAMELKPLSHISTLTSHQLLRRGCVVLADCLLQCNDAVLTGATHYTMPSTSNIEAYSERLVTRPDLVKELASFVRQAFRCLGGATDSERLYASREIHRMVSLFPYLTKAPSLSVLLGRVAVEVAMDFAEGTGEPDDHLWAVEIQETMIALQEESSSEAVSDFEDQGPRKGLYRWEESIGEWVARSPAIKQSQMPTLCGKGRPSLSVASRSPRIPCSTDSSSPASDCFEESASSLTSSPSSVGMKRVFEEVDSSPLRPAKRRRATPIVVVGRSEGRATRSLSTSTAPRSPSLEPVPDNRRALRAMPNQRATSSSAPTAAKPTTKIEVVIINNKESRPNAGPVKPPSQPVKRQSHRSVERRRPGRPSVSTVPTAAPRVTPRQRSVIPCSEDESDDELSFI
ncbi:uncharacterized protein N7459_006581 [Penicillium hispanicum]|uniref:uncharacterized protein n=1 Tax=Penicillium hispanicum TaxID=1080232 RepID=UPI00253FF50C|nr:uncharacterized protein N7459_006581 [Penicillium hispanicum]KAJ5577617.1 hypothetical protein N7459_006581 [Penicillium hispanicum]